MPRGRLLFDEAGQVIDWTEQAVLQSPNLLGSLGILVAGSKRRSGWLIGAASEIAWTYWGIRYHDPGILPWCVIWGIFYVRNYVKWSPGGTR